MESNITYLASRSLAVYEAGLLDKYERNFKTWQLHRAVKVSILCSCVIFLAAVSLFSPALLFQISSP